jgi:glycosyltransferase involved in cell wall biosynthesis
MKACAIVPALDARESLGGVLDDLAREFRDVPVVVVDDGSQDGTADVARARGVPVLVHERNRGKGAAIRTGLEEAARRGVDVALTVDADGQHPARSARAVLEATGDAGALVVGVRDLVRAGAPRPNVRSNAISNFFLSRFAGRPLADTQCGLRRYPVRATLALGARSRGYAFEAEVLLRALAAGMPLVEVAIDVVYPDEAARRTHFHVVRDPARIVAAVLRTTLELRLGGARRSSSGQ